jgi:hypothetical protein
MSVGASNISGERIRLFERAMVPQSTSISEGKVLVYCQPAAIDNLAVDVPTGPTALLGGRAFAGLCADVGSVQLPQDNQVLVAKGGIHRGLLLAGESCVAGADCGYDPADGGRVKSVTPSNAARMVPVGRFTQTRSSSGSDQLVGVELYSHSGSVGASQLLGMTLGASAPVSNTVTETAFNQSVSIPAGRLYQAGTRLKVKARVTAASAAANDTLQIRARLDSATGALIGASPAVDVTNAGGDIGILDLDITIRSVGPTGVFQSVGTGGICPGQAVATGGNLQTTGAAAAVTFDTTIAHTVVITAQWSAANVANSCVLEILTVEIQG